MTGREHTLYFYVCVCVGCGEGGGVSDREAEELQFLSSEAF